MSHHLLLVSSVYGLTAGRAWSLVAILLGVVGMVIGARTLARSSPGGPVTRRATLSLSVGLLGTVIGGAVVAASDGGPGTGYGIVGGFVALVVGTIGNREALPKFLGVLPVLVDA